MKHMQNALTKANEAKPHILKDEVKRQKEATAKEVICCNFFMLNDFFLLGLDFFSLQLTKDITLGW